MDKKLYPRIGEEVIWETLDNGLPVCIVPKQGFSRKYALFATRYGGMDMRFELKGQWLDTPAGIAHYLEHKMFDTKDGNALQELAKNGAEPNAFTSNAITCYYFDSTEKFYENLEILLSFVSVPYFTDESVEKEQGIIGQEIKMYDDSPDWRLMNTLLSCLYEKHPIREDIAGSCESIAQLTPELLYDCCRAFYQPGNLVLAAAGNITMEQLLAACARAGLDKPRPQVQVERLWPAESPAVAQPQKTLYMPVPMPWLGIGFKEQPIPAEDLRTEALYDLICGCILGGMSPLYRRLYDQGLVDPDFGGSVLHTEGCCCFLFAGESSSPELVQQMLLEEIARVRKEGVDREVFTLCKHERYGQLIENLENVEDSASQMADFALAGQTVAQQIEMLAGLTAEDADRALQQIFSTDRMAVVQILPDGSLPSDETEGEDFEE